VVNPLDSPVTNISIYAWAKNDAGKVFALGRTDFKNDLLGSGGKLDFKVMVLPFQSDQTMSSYEISAWGKRYKLSPQ